MFRGRLNNLKKYRLTHIIRFLRPIYFEKLQYYSRKDPAHDYRHIERIISRLDLLSEGLNPPPVPHRLYFLACFHGLGSQIAEDTNLREEVNHFLQELGWPGREIEESFASLLKHLEDPTSPEEMIVHDANYYEVVGAFGIAKAFTTGGARGQSYEETVNLFQNRILMKVTFRTPVGNRLAEERRAYTEDFLLRLKSEW